MADAARPVFKLVQEDGAWFGRIDLRRDDGLIGPFHSGEEAEEDA
jgi:hypothetical protein